MEILSKKNSEATYSRKITSDQTTFTFVKTNLQGGIMETSYSKMAFRSDNKSNSFPNIWIQFKDESE
jgi:hypothetical protein